MPTPRLGSTRRTWRDRAAEREGGTGNDGQRTALAPGDRGASFAGTASPKGLSSFLCGVSGSCCWVETSGVGDGERVKRSFPALGPGAEFTSSVVSDIADGQVEDLQNGVVGGEMPAGFGDFAELIVQRLDSVGGVDDLADRSVEGQERREPFPVTSRSVGARDPAKSCTLCSTESAWQSTLVG